MPTYRSKTSTQGRNMAGARALWRATGMHTEDFEKPIVAVANSFTQFVPGHVHLQGKRILIVQRAENRRKSNEERENIREYSSKSGENRKQMNWGHLRPEISARLLNNAPKASSWRTASFSS